MEPKQPTYAYLKDANGVCRAACLFEEVVVRMAKIPPAPPGDDQLHSPEARIIYSWIVLNPSDQDYRPEVKDRLRKRFNRGKNCAIFGLRSFVRPFKRYQGLRVQGSPVVLELQALQFDKIGYDCNIERFNRDLKQMREFVAGQGSYGRIIVFGGNPAGRSSPRLLGTRIEPPEDDENPDETNPYDLDKDGHPNRNGGQ